MYHHWQYTNVDTQGANPTFSCARATSTSAYSLFNGDSANYTQVGDHVHSQHRACRAQVRHPCSPGR